MGTLTPADMEAVVERVRRQRRGDHAMTQQKPPGKRLNAEIRTVDATAPLAA